MGGCLAEHGAQEVVQATKLDGMPVVDARRAVGEDLLKKPCKQRDRHANARPPPHEVTPSNFVGHQQEEVAAEVDDAPPRLCCKEQREHDGAV
jgi:hypothetical protein